MTVKYKATQEKYIFSYRNKEGEIKFMYRLHLGRDKVTGNPKNTTKRNFDTIKAAKEARENAKSKLDLNAANITGESLRFDDLVEPWLKYYEPKVEPSTFDKTKALFKNHISPVMGDKEIHTITADDCENFIDIFSTRLVNFEQLGHYASRVLRYACKHKLLQSNPFDELEENEKKGVSNSRKKRKKIDVRRRYFTPDEIIEILDFLEHEESKQVHTFFRVLTLTGCRKGEILALKWNNIDFTNKKINIFHAVGYSKHMGLYISGTKNHLMRTIAIDEETLSLLKNWQNEQKTMLKKLNIKYSKDQLIFPNKNNTLMYPTKTEQWLFKARKHLSFSDDVKFTPHTFRHSYATICFENGINTQLIQQRLGHACDENTTSKFYIHLTDKADREICDKYAAILHTAKQEAIKQATNDDFTKAA